ncbi:MAG: tRNA (cytidine(56)-2'-O)-methyltransferase [Thermoplasmata archaeon]
MPARRKRRPDVAVLRIGHRPGRDPRLTTHVALAARAFGAGALYVHPPDPGLSERLEAVARRWGGSFRVMGVTDWRSFVRHWKGAVVHLTMYGEALPAVIPRLRRRHRILLVVGGAKVPPSLYSIADVNVAIGHQPHSEVAAVAIMLERLFGWPGGEPWDGARQVIRPSPRGKDVVELPRQGTE